MIGAPDPHHRHRFPAAIIAHAVWLYHAFTLSFRDVELLLAERGVILSYETVRRWCLKFAQRFANGLRRRRPRPGGKWHLDEVFLSIGGKRHYLWRAVDQDGTVLDILVQSRGNAQAAKRFFRKLLKGLRYVPRAIVTDKLPSYGAAKRAILPGVEHRQSQYLNNRAENSRQPTRRRERQMQRSSRFATPNASCRPMVPSASTAGHPGIACRRPIPCSPGGCPWVWLEVTCVHVTA